VTEPAADPREPYSPELRTALILTGTGAAGAYHAGVLRALHEAGVKIDVVAGAGIGVVGATFAAIDGAARLWDANGVWRAPGLRTLYRPRRALAAAQWTLVAACAALLVPIALLAVGLGVYALGFVLRMAGLASGSALVLGYARLIEQAFQPDGLPTLLPRAVTLMVISAAAVVLGSAYLAYSTRQRRDRGPIWWLILAAPWSSTEAIHRIADGLWTHIRGAAAVAQPGLREFGRRYAELLADNLGQPGFRELLLTAHDLDARRDLVFALLAEPHRTGFFGRSPRGERRAEALDLAGVERDHAFDAVAGALSVPVMTPPHPLTFAPDGFWRGETHRLCQRSGAAARLLAESLRAGVQQVIVVGADPELHAPHALSARPSSLRGRIGEYLAGADASSLDDAIAAWGSRFEALFTIRPTHTAIGPFDFGGAYDERSDRHQSIGELIERGYEDAYRQFIEPVVGASGDRLPQAV
jgi:patatin-like phospholipase